MEIIKTYESKISHSGLMRLMSGVVRINGTLYDFCLWGFLLGGGDVLSKGFNFNRFANIDFCKNAARREVGIRENYVGCCSYVHSLLVKNSFGKNELA